MELKNHIGYALLSGAADILVAPTIIYVVSGGQYPNKETAKYIFPAAFLTGIALYTIFEITGMHKKLCNGSN